MTVNLNGNITYLLYCSIKIIIISHFLVKSDCRNVLNSHQSFELRKTCSNTFSFSAEIKNAIQEFIWSRSKFMSILIDKHVFVTSLRY